MKRLYIALVMLLAMIYACGVMENLPSGKTGSFSVSEVPTATNSASPTLSAEEIGVVIVDTALRVRVCPSESCQMAHKDGKEWYLYPNDVVMGTCYHFSDGSIWFGFNHVDGEPTRYSAVYLDGEWMMEAGR